MGEIIVLAILCWCVYETTSTFMTLRYAPYKITGITGVNFRIVEETTMFGSKTEHVFLIEARHPIFKIWVTCLGGGITLTDKHYFDTLEEAEEMVKAWKTAYKVLSSKRIVKRVHKEEPENES